MVLTFTVWSFLGHQAECAEKLSWLEPQVAISVRIPVQGLSQSQFTFKDFLKTDFWKQGFCFIYFAWRILFWADLSKPPTELFGESLLAFPDFSLRTLCLWGIWAAMQTWRISHVQPMIALCCIHGILLVFAGYLFIHVLNENFLQPPQDFLLV